jgi:hypothetical protein
MHAESWSTLKSIVTEFFYFYFVLQRQAYRGAATEGRGGARDTRRVPFTPRARACTTRMRLARCCKVTCTHKSAGDTKNVARTRGPYALPRRMHHGDASAA